MAFVGDDLVDIAVMQQSGFAITVANATSVMFNMRIGKQRLTVVKARSEKSANLFYVRNNISLSRVLFYQHENSIPNGLSLIHCYFYCCAS